MTDYWDAVTRAVLGQPGSADPRPRSIFEPDIGDGAGAEIMAATDDEALEPPRKAISATPAPRLADGPDGAGPRRTAAPDPLPPQLTPPVSLAPAAAVHEVAASGIAAAAPPAPAGPAQTAADAHSQPPPEPIQAAGAAPEDRHEEREPISEAAASDRPVLPRAVVQADAGPMERPAGILTRQPGPPDVVAAEAGPAPVSVIAEPAGSVQESASTHPGELAPLLIEINRIEIRIEPEGEHRPPPMSRPVDSGSIPSLADYLARRSEAAR